MSVQKEQQDENFLETVIMTILNRKDKFHFDLKNQELNQLFNELRKVISEFDGTLSECRKYNEAKIHRKYEIRIADLQKQIQFLKIKVQAEQQARDPSKKYVEDLVSQLVVYKNENNLLKKQIEDTKKVVEDLSFKLSLPSSDYLYKNKSSKDIENQKTKLINFKNEISKYLSEKNIFRKMKGEPRSTFQGYLKRVRNSVEDDTFPQFMDKINTWVDQILRRNQQYNPERVKSNILSSFGDSMEILPESFLPSIKNSKNSILSSNLTQKKRRQYSAFSQENNKLSFSLK